MNSNRTDPLVRSGAEGQFIARIPHDQIARAEAPAQGGIQGSLHIGHQVGHGGVGGRITGTHRNHNLCALTIDDEFHVTGQHIAADRALGRQVGRRNHGGDRFVGPDNCRGHTTRDLLTEGLPEVINIGQGETVHEGERDIEELGTGQGV